MVLTCDRCFRKCRIPPGEAGECGAVRNDGGLSSLYGEVSTLGTGPIEERAVFHLRPGMNVMLAGMKGCNLHCRFCMNHDVSQNMGAPASTMMPGTLAREAVRRGAEGMCFTFSEPLVCFDFVMDTFEEAREKGLLCVLKTNAIYNRLRFGMILSRCDAVNIDFKGARSYNRLCGADENAYSDLLANMASAAQAGILEVSVLSYGDEEEDIASLSVVQTYAGPETPVHLIPLVPSYLMKGARYPSKSYMTRLVGIAKDMFWYAYGHSPGSTNNTLCPWCGNTLVRRTGTRLASNYKEGGCSRCSEVIRQVQECATTTNARDARKSSR